jgi:hypothetical protein
VGSAGSPGGARAGLDLGGAGRACTATARGPGAAGPCASGPTRGRAGAVLGSARRSRPTRTCGGESGRAVMGCAARPAGTADGGPSSARPTAAGACRAAAPCARRPGSDVGTPDRRPATRGPGGASSGLGAAERPACSGRRWMGSAGRAGGTRVAAAVLGRPRRGRARISARAVMGGAC